MARDSTKNKTVVSHTACSSNTTNMKRRLFNFTVALNLLFLLAVISLWIHSYYMTDGLSTKSFSQTSFSARSESGGIVFTKWVGSPERNWSIYSHEPDTWMYLNPDGEFFGFASGSTITQPILLRAAFGRVLIR